MSEVTPLEIVAAHAMPIVDDVNQVVSTSLELDFDMVRACVEAIVEELANDTARTFDHLSRSDLPRDCGIEDSDSALCFGHEPIVLRLPRQKKGCSPASSPGGKRGKN